MNTKFDVGEVVYIPATIERINIDKNEELSNPHHTHIEEHYTVQLSIGKSLYLGVNDLLKS